MAKDKGVVVHVFKGERGIEPLSKPVEDSFFNELGALVPPFDPLKLTDWYEDSNSLAQNVAAYATNIDGFGYVLEPVVDFDSAAGLQALRSDLERDGKELSDAEFEAHVAKLRKEAEAERIRLKNFIDYISVGISFTTLRKRTRIDLEATGNAYWEILRDEDRNIAKIVLVPSHMMRLMPVDKDAVDFVEHQRVGALGWEEAQVKRRFRRFVQKLDTGVEKVFFKEFGDPRVVSSSTGAVYDDEAAMHEEEDRPDNLARAASEIVHFRIYSPSSPYGVPRWVGNLPSVLGSREMEEVNLAYFKNKGVPPLAILVSGGVMTNEAIKRLEDVLEKEIKGKSNFHKVWVIEATTEDGSNVAPRLELKPLMSAQLSDAVFQSYDERNIDKVGSAFRVPRLLRGDVRDFNRSTSWASIRFAEEQVFAGEREEEDFVVNRTIFADMQVKFWRYRSLGPTIRDPETIVTLLVELAKVAAMTPNEVREITAKTLHVDLARIEEDWAMRPPSFTLAGRGFTPAGVNSEQIAETQEDGEVERLEGMLSDLQARIAGVRASAEEERESKEAAEFRSTISRYAMLPDELNVSTSDTRTDKNAPRRDSTEGDETPSA